MNLYTNFLYPNTFKGNSFSKRKCSFNFVIISLLAICYMLTFGAQKAEASITDVAAFPISFSTEGRIEVKAQLIGFSASSVIPWGASPYIFKTQTSSGNGFCCTLDFNGNDGAGGGGLSGVFEGAAYIHDTAATGYFAQPYTYGDILGNQQSVDSWHTYDLVWNVNGISQAGGNRVAVFIDGQLNSGYFQNTFSPHFSGSGNLILGGLQTPVSGDIAFDELRVWNTSTPNPGSLVLANSFESQALISSIGPNGTYISGQFINGAVGNAVSTVVPVPAALWLFGSILPILIMRVNAKSGNNSLAEKNRSC